jgi:DNA repair protein RadC
VLKPAILKDASSIILAHNHPSGNSQASRADKRLTDRVVKSAELLNIKVDDQVNFRALKPKA